MEYQLIMPRIPLKNATTAVEQVLANRGISPENVEHYLHTTDADICDPSMIMNMREGAAMLVKHISQNDKVLVQIDSDCDGYTSAAALINDLN